MLSRQPRFALRNFPALALFLLLLSGLTAAQNVQYTGNEADKSLKSAARVDPSTLGMSLEIPLGAYPGRGGAQLPLAIKYSSKVWNIDFNYSYQSYINTLAWTRAAFGARSAAGWTSSLTPPRLQLTGRD